MFVLMCYFSRRYNTANPKTHNWWLSWASSTLHIFIIHFHMTHLNTVSASHCVQAYSNWPLYKRFLNNNSVCVSCVLHRNTCAVHCNLLHLTTLILLRMAVSVWEQSAEENIWTAKRESKRRMKKLQMRRSIIFTFHQILRLWQNEGGWDHRGM
jgi:hypothetical protein